MPLCPRGTDTVDCTPDGELSCVEVDGFSTILRKQIRLPRDRSGTYTFRAEFNDEASATVIVDDEVELSLQPTIDRPVATFDRVLAAGEHYIMVEFVERGGQGGGGGFAFLDWRIL
eukprot:SAG31_NODE_133_length_23315_cov_4.858847_4_plen_116_part_00